MAVGECWEMYGFLRTIQWVSLLGVASLKGTYFSPPSAAPPLPWRFSLFLSLGALGVGVAGFGAWLSSCWVSLFSDSVSPPWGDEVSLE